jgi:predicted small metal-binding protein
MGASFGTKLPLGKGEGGARIRAVLCASLCNCRHSLKADDDERLVEVALEHLRQSHPAAPLKEERVRKIISTRAYAIEYAGCTQGTLGLTRSSVPNPIERLAIGAAKGDNLVRPEEAQVGKRVWVRDSLHRAELKGKEGTIRARWGNPDFVALDVVLETAARSFSGTTSWRRQVTERGYDGVCMAPTTSWPSPTQWILKTFLL